MGDSSPREPQGSSGGFSLQIVKNRGETKNCSRGLLSMSGQEVTSEEVAVTHHMQQERRLGQEAGGHPGKMDQHVCRP